MIKLKEIRIKKKLTQNELSELSKVPQSSISDIENNKTIPSILTLTKIAKVLNVKIEDLIEYQEETVEKEKAI
jgi:transcriptional regulator with XRE-family HTH domain